MTDHDVKVNTESQVAVAGAKAKQEEQVGDDRFDPDKLRLPRRRDIDALLRKPGPKPRLPTVAERHPLTTSNTRTFKLVRTQDETGISGTGVVAEGIEFTNGWCALSWLTAMHSVAVYPNVRAVEAIHGHNGRTKVLFD